MSRRLGLFSRPAIQAVERVHDVIVPGGMTLARLVVDGWGWVSARPVGAKSSSRTFFLGRTVLRVQLPVNETVSVTVLNPWGRERRYFIVHSTHNQMPETPRVPVQRTLPTVAPTAISDVAVPALRLHRQCLIVRLPSNPSQAGRFRISLTERRLRPPWTARGVPGFLSLKRLAAIEQSSKSRAEKSGRVT
jgi:hypothetical protein